jgi:hypothetical protein
VKLRVPRAADLYTVGGSVDGPDIYPQRRQASPALRAFDRTPAQAVAASAFPKRSSTRRTFLSCQLNVTAVVSVVVSVPMHKLAAEVRKTFLGSQRAEQHVRARQAI